MSMTITEKILAYSSQKKKVNVKEVKPGDIIEIDVDILLTHDAIGPDVVTIYDEEFKKEFPYVWNKDRIVVFPDHWFPCKDIDSANRMLRLRKWVKEQGIVHYYPEGKHGICHEMMAQEGFAMPGYVILGTDSHTCTAGAHGAFATGVGFTAGACVAARGKYPFFVVPESMKLVYHGELQEGVYAKDMILYTLGKIGAKGALKKTMEFCGDAIKELSAPERRTMCNMAVEASAINGIIAPDHSMEMWSEELRHPELPRHRYFQSDEDAKYSKVLEFDADKIEPQVSKPFLPANAVPVSEVEGIKIDQAFIGSCTNGRMDDLIVAAGILDGNKVAEDVRLIIIPATQKIWGMAMEEGIFDVFHDAGAVISTPTCGPCLGGYMGILGKGEVCISTSNRNFEERMGAKDSLIYLASPATVAASAIEGKITDPRRYV